MANINDYEFNLEGKNLIRYKNPSIEHLDMNIDNSFKSVTNINNRAFKNNETLKSIVFSSNVINIGRLLNIVNL
jgi:hypothetical protein